MRHTLHAGVHCWAHWPHARLTHVVWMPRVRVRTLLYQAAFMAWWEDTMGGAAMSPRSRGVGSAAGSRDGGYDDAGSAAGSQGGKKLTVVRHLRKQAQNDAQLLINRIALLRVRGWCRCLCDHYWLPLLPPDGVRRRTG